MSLENNCEIIPIPCLQKNITSIKDLPREIIHMIFDVIFTLDVPYEAICLGLTSRQFYPIFKKIYPSPIQSKLYHSSPRTLQRLLGKFMGPKYRPGSSYKCLFLNIETYGKFAGGKKEKMLLDRWESH